MKVLKIGLPIAGVVLGSAVVGGSWFTGKTAQEHYYQLVDHFNDTMLAQDIPLQIKNVNVERNLFSSDVNYQIQVGDNSESLSIQGNDTLYHGPLPLNRLKTGNILPMAASLESKWQVPDVLKEMFRNKEHLLTGTTNLGYGGGLDGKLSLSSIDFAEDGKRLSTTPLNLAYALDSKQDKGELKLSLDEVYLTERSQHQSAKFKSIGLEMELKDEPNYSSLSSGNVNFSIGSSDIQWGNQESLQIGQVSYQGQSTMKANRNLSSTVIKVQNINANNMDLGHLNLDIHMDLDAQAVDELFPYLYELDTLSAKERERLVLNVARKAPKFEIKELTLQNGKGKADLKLLLDIAPFDTMKFDSVIELLNLFNQSNLNFSLSRDYLENIATQVSMLSMPKETAQWQAKRLADEIFENAARSEYIQAKDGRLSLDIKFNKGEILLNGKVLSEQELQGLIFMLAMAGYL